jgi:hypothetical protein
MLARRLSILRVYRHAVEIAPDLLESGGLTVSRGLSMPLAPGRFRGTLCGTLGFLLTASGAVREER